MGERIIYVLSVIFSIGALALLILNTALINNDQHLQKSIVIRQAKIDQGITLSRANQGLIQALAEAAVKNNDTAMRELLASQGITINTPSAPASADKHK